VIEPLGEQVDLSCDLPGGERALLRIDARADLRAGEALRIYLDPDHLHLFERGEFGTKLLHAPAAR